MLVILSQIHAAQLIAWLIMIAPIVIGIGGIGMASSTILAEREDWSLPENNLNYFAGVKSTSEIEASFLKVLEDHHGIIYKICNLYCNNRSDGDDLYQDIVYNLWKGYTTFQNKSKISTWMYSVAIHTAIISYRDKPVNVEFVENLPDILRDEPSLNQGDDELRKLFFSLSKTDRTIVALMMENYTQVEIAAIMGLREGTVAMRMNRLRESGRW